LISASVLSTLSLHDALPICLALQVSRCVAEIRAVDERTFGSGLDRQAACRLGAFEGQPGAGLRRQVELRARAHACEVDGRVDAEDRKSTRLNSSHLVISYAV